MIKDLFSKKWGIVSVLVLLLFGQLVYSFLYPSVGLDDNWQPISQYLQKFSVEGSDNFLLSTGLSFVSPNYRLNSDVGHYLELAKDFSPQYFAESPFMERPLYPLMIFLASLPLRIFAPASYGMIFAASMLVNFALISAAVILFFFLLQKIFSPKVAWLSSILLIFSPFVHSYINQPLAEMLMAFAVVLAGYLLYNYAKDASSVKLVVFSLIIGLLMLGKMFFAISFFILLLALYFRRLREGAVFAVMHLLPFLFWYIWTTKIWHIAYRTHQMTDWDMGVWIFRIFSMPWQKTYEIFLALAPNFISALIYAFLLFPVVFSIIGLRQMHFKHKNIVYFSAILAVFGLGFLAKFFYIRHVFLLFPLIYPAAVLGIEETAKYAARGRQWIRLLLYAMLIGFIIIVSNIDIYRVFDYNL
ncbi:MAG: hypothetical protein HYT21_03125 [Candidatus Nealsonbacteria bacterium]|nr:hypothetical protein [Candidatus Nealsonbacteria bacterium]